MKTFLSFICTVIIVAIIAGGLQALIQAQVTSECFQFAKYSTIAWVGQITYGILSFGVGIWLWNCIRKV